MGDGDRLAASFKEPGPGADLDQRVPGAASAARGSVEVRSAVLAGAALCVGRWGLSKTTVDDIAREAGVSRATVYRAFPGGKEEILRAVVSYEEARFFAGLAQDLERATGLEEMVVTAVVEASRFMSANPVLNYLLEHEPETVLPHLALDRIGPLLYRCSAFLGPHLERFMAPDAASEVAEWAARVVVSYWLERSDRFDLRREDDARRMVKRYLLPGVAPSCRSTHLAGDRT